METITSYHQILPPETRSKKAERVYKFIIFGENKKTPKKEKQDAK